MAADELARSGGPNTFPNTGMNHDHLLFLLAAALMLGAVAKSFDTWRYEKVVIGFTCVGVFAIGFAIVVSVVRDVTRVIPPTRNMFVDNFFALLLIAMGVAIAAIITCFGSMIFAGIRKRIRSA